MKYIVTLRHGDQLGCTLEDGWYVNRIASVEQWRCRREHPAVASINPQCEDSPFWYPLNPINDVAIDALVAAKAYAESLGHNSQGVTGEALFLQGLERLKRYTEIDHPGHCTLVSIAKDFAPFSFTFYVSRNGKCLVAGGLIYQGPLPESEKANPRFNVSLAEGTGWFVHT